MGTQPKAAAKPADTAKDRVDLRLYNRIVIFDDYVVAKSPEAANEIFMNEILEGRVAPMESVCKEVTMANSIRSSKTDDKPLVANDVTDEEFETLKGITNSAAFERFYTRRG